MAKAGASGPDDRGKVARSQVPRSSHAAWQAPPDRDPVAILEAQAPSRVPELVPIRYGRMVESPFAFYRGAAAVMAADLADTPITGIRAQLCGDAHIANFGGFAAPDRRLIFDINDFDETLPGPWEWDLKRLGASVAIAARANGIDTGRSRDAVAACARSYREAIRDFAGQGNLDVWYARLDEAAVDSGWGHRASPKEVDRVRKRAAKARGKDRLRAFAKLTRDDGDGPRIISDPPLIVPLEELVGKRNFGAATKRIRELLSEYGKSLDGDVRTLLDQYEYVDLARKVVGVGSVGTRTFIVLALGSGEGDPLFLQVKEAEASVLEPYAGRSRFRHHSRRVIEGQWLMQAASDIFLGWLTAEGIDGVSRAFYLRQLWDWKVSPDIATMSGPMLLGFGEMCGWTLARAHARSGDRAAIASYLGRGEVFDWALAQFAETYADQNERDHAALADAVKSGRVEATRGV